MRALFALVLTNLPLASARGNMHAPPHCDSCAAGHALVPTHAAEAVELKDETLAVRLANLENMAEADFEVTYRFRNTRSEPLELPVEFVAERVRDPRIRVNGNVTGYCLSRKERDESERIAALDPKLRVKPSPWGRSDTESFNVIGFVLKLNPGENRVSVVYSQSLNQTREGGNKKEQVFWFDYFLYPARDWQLSSDFDLKVNLALFTPQRSFLFWKSDLATEVHSSLSLVEAGSHAHPRIWTGHFREVPSDIWRFVVRVPD